MLIPWLRLLVVAAAVPLKGQAPWSDDSVFEAWTRIQASTAFQLLLENIGGTLTTLDVPPGTVVALPLQYQPNYYYTWIRDSALTIRLLIYHMHDHADETRATLQQAVELYIAANAILQRLDNPLGTFDDPALSGLGEPKFMVDGTPFQEKWGRPQADGPALRVLTIANYLNYLRETKGKVGHGDLQSPLHIYCTIVRPDLDYVMANWQNTLFDLWEEKNSRHFFTLMVQLRSLKDGYDLAAALGESTAYLRALNSLYRQLEQHVTGPAGGFATMPVPYIVETPELFERHERSGLDAASLLALLHAHNLEWGHTLEIPFDVDDPRILSTLRAMVSDMQARYPVNYGQPSIALGRYPEDVYDGVGTSEGNPWFICTASAAELLYKVIYKKVTARSDLVITNANRAFYAPFLSEHKTILVIEYGTQHYTETLEKLLAYLDAFLKSVKLHVDANGHMLEQFNRYTGYMQGARDLTWLYLALYNSVRWRAKATGAMEALLSEQAALRGGLFGFPGRATGPAKPLYAGKL